MSLYGIDAVAGVNSSPIGCAALRPGRDRGAGARSPDCLFQRLDVVGAVVAAAVDEEGRGAAHVAEVGAVDVLCDPRRADMGLELLGEPVDVERELVRV